MLFSPLNIKAKSNFLLEKFYYRNIHWSIFTFIIEISILEEIIEVYIGDAFRRHSDS